ncbi:MarR family winged helix-turn-helix transcriptional regulator [Nocardia flavorosea]|uniref:MarR family winged helix-turn-helix transcriptional regulator n=1 Tax=Nocardia flavorosea TaxID=53429 RepID=UPI002B4AEDB8|nr:MarR family transcriptional regulator [Nocardia flavorosea]
MQPNRGTDVDDSVVDLLVTAGRLTRAAGMLSAEILPHATVRALAALEERGPLRISEFARIDRTSQPTATTLIARLVREGYVSRRRDPDDSRAVVVELTPTGRARLAASRAAIRAALPDPLPGFDAERLTGLAADLRELLAVIRETTGNHTQPRKHR